MSGLFFIKNITTRTFPVFTIASAIRVNLIFWWIKIMPVLTFLFECSFG
ncbi:hypothetical protein D083_4211 [Dickeya solani RNS 08.23.3.1.A]|nr:hypothetical protein D083_4211 [Dickeya solani RNS 08.23.3.1.A]